MNKEAKKQTDDFTKKYNDSIRSLIADLESKDGQARKTAREKLIAMGRPAVEYLAGLIEHPKDVLRWEGLKALGGIADPDSVPLLVQAMSNDNEKVRWLAAEGLIAIGPAAIGPAIEEFLCDPKSLWIRRGVRHILIGLSSRVKIDELYDLIGALNGREPALYAPAVAYRTLKKVGHSKSGGPFCGQDRHLKKKAA